MELEAYDGLQFYYHPDHLGSTSYVTNPDGEEVSTLSMYRSAMWRTTRCATIGSAMSMALPIWAKYMQRVLNDSTLGYDPTQQFDIPEWFDPNAGCR